MAKRNRVLLKPQSLAEYYPRSFQAQGIQTSFQPVEDWAKKLLYFLLIFRNQPSSNSTSKITIMTPISAMLDNVAVKQGYYQWCNSKLKIVYAARGAKLPVVEKIPKTQHHNRTGIICKILILLPHNNQGLEKPAAPKEFRKENGKYNPARTSEVMGDLAEDWVAEVDRGWAKQWFQACRESLQRHRGNYWKEPWSKVSAEKRQVDCATAAG
ncbi:hypothetical protein C8R43DRAFT_943900 [Mycena crocata]|nr:hypothetical protein C8R43DRAFT_943900 [Mycena crocata]